MFSPIETEKERILVLDFQGFDDEADEVVNSKLFAIATLMSSTILFNIKQNLNYETLKHMKLAVELPSLIKMKADGCFVSNSLLVS